MLHFHTRIFNGKLVARLLGVMLLVMAGFMVFPAILSFCYNDGVLEGFLLSIIVMIVLGVFFRNILGRLASYEFHEKESFWITGIVTFNKINIL